MTLYHIIVDSEMQNSECRVQNKPLCHFVTSPPFRGDKIKVALSVHCTGGRFAPIISDLGKI